MSLSEGAGRGFFLQVQGRTVPQDGSGGGGSPEGQGQVSGSMSKRAAAGGCEWASPSNWTRGLASGSRWRCFYSPGRGRACQARWAPAPAHRAGSLRLCTWAPAHALRHLSPAPAVCVHGRGPLAHARACAPTPTPQSLARPTRRRHARGCQSAPRVGPVGDVPAAAAATAWKRARTISESGGKGALRISQLFPSSLPLHSRILPDARSVQMGCWAGGRKRLLMLSPTLTLSPSECHWQGACSISRLSCLASSGP